MELRTRMLLSILSGIVVTAVAMHYLLPWLKKLKAGQAIREDGPQSHLKKAGTPTMGGISIILGTIVVSLIFGSVSADCLIVLATFLAFGLVGFLDDYLKVTKHDNLGLRAWQKFGLQFIFSLAIAWYKSRQSTAIALPFSGKLLDLGTAGFIIFAVFVALAMTNSVNLTDGLDGLASSVTMLVAIVFGYISMLRGNNGVAVILNTMGGACIGFLFYNAHPAKVFMGDTGSLALGGGLAAAAIITGQELLLPILGIIYVAEAMSVIIQVFVFQTQHGRRFFRMAPLHHHFELGGWEEQKVVKVFSTITGVVCLIMMFVIEFITYGQM